MTSRVAAALLVSGDRFLLGHRHPDRENQPDVWDLPGGHIEEGEEPSEAVTRELLEELAIDVSGSVREPWRTIVVDDVEVVVFVIDAWAGLVQNNEPSEHDALAWFTLDEVSPLRLASPLYVDLLRQAMGDRAEDA